MRLVLPAALAALAAVAIAACSGKQGREAGAPRDGGDAAQARTEAGSSDGTPGGPAEGAHPDYRLAPLDGRGRVEGGGSALVVVKWLDPPLRAVRSPGRNACGTPTRPPASFYVRDRQRHVNAVRNAVVSFEGVEAGRRPDASRPVELGIRACRLEPAVVRAPRIGAPLAVVSDDERRHEVVVEHLGAGGSPPELLARVPLPLVGQRYEVPLDRPGIVRATSRADERDHAYVVVPGHPYVAVTGDRGSARFDQVPAGRYEVTVWHPPLDPGGEPLAARAELVVEAGKTRQLEIELAP
jgi:hypothetical protein